MACVSVPTGAAAKEWKVSILARGESGTAVSVLLRTLLVSDNVLGDGQSCDLGCAVAGHKNGGLKVCHLGTSLLVDNLVGLQQLVVHALDDTHASLFLIIHGADGEGQCCKLLVHFIDDITAASTKQKQQHISTDKEREMAALCSQNGKVCTVTPSSSGGSSGPPHA